MVKNMWIFGLLMTSATNVMASSSSQVLNAKTPISPVSQTTALEKAKPEDVREPAKQEINLQVKEVSSDTLKSPTPNKTPAKDTSKPNVGTVEQSIKSELLKTTAPEASPSPTQSDLDNAKAGNKTAVDQIKETLTAVTKELDEIDQAEQQLGQVQATLKQAQSDRQGLEKSTNDTISSIRGNISKITKAYEDDNNAIKEADKNVADPIKTIKEKLKSDQAQAQKDSEAAGVTKEFNDKLDKSISSLDDAIKQSKEVQVLCDAIVARLKKIRDKDYVKTIDTAGMLQKLEEALGVPTVKSATNEASAALETIKDKNKPSIDGSATTPQSRP